MPDYGKIYESSIVGKTPEQIAKIKTSFVDKYNYDPDNPIVEVEAPVKVEKTTPVETSGATAQVKKPAPVIPSSGDSTDTTDVAVDNVPNEEWDDERANEYNIIANTRARVSDLRNSGNNKYADSFGYELRRKEAIYVAKYGELPEFMEPFTTPEGAKKGKNVEVVEDKEPTIKEKLETKQKELNTKYADRGDELIDNSKVLQNFRSTFDKQVQSKIDNKVQQLISQYPDWATNPDVKDKIFGEQGILQGYYQDLFEKAINKSEIVRKEEERIQKLVGSEYEAELAPFNKQLKDEARAEYEASPLKFAINVAKKLFNPHSTFGVPTNNKYVDQIEQSLVFSIGSIKDASDLGGISLKANKVNRLVDKNERDLESGKISKREYDYNLKRYNIQKGAQVAERIEEVSELENEAVTKELISNVITDIDDPNFHTPENYALVVADQAFNLGLGVIPELVSKVNPGVGTALRAVALSAYALQEYSEYEDKALRAAFSRVNGIAEDEISEQDLAEFALSPEGIKISKQAGIDAGVSGSISTIIDKFTLGAGGIAKSSKIVQKLLDATRKMKYLQRLRNTKTFRIGTVAAHTVKSAAGESFEEVTQLGIGEYGAERQRTDGSVITRLGNVIKNADKKEYRTAAILGAIGSGGTSVAGATLNIGKIALDPNAPIANLNKISKLSPVDFQDFIELSKANYSTIYNDPLKSDQDKLAAKIHLTKLLDLETAHNELKSFPTIKGKARARTLELLSERSRLKRFADNTGNTGLATNNKERIKNIDEQLATIERRAKRGYKSTFLEKLRGQVGPKRSVGAARKANVPQKLIDTIDGLLQAGENIPSIRQGLTSLVQKAGFTGQAVEPTTKILDAELSKFDTSNFTQLSAYVKFQEESQAGFERGEAATEPSAQGPKVVLPKGLPSEGTIPTDLQADTTQAYHDAGFRVPERLSKRFETGYVAPIHLRNVGQALPGPQGTIAQSIATLTDPQGKPFLDLLALQQQNIIKELQGRFTADKKSYTKNQSALLNEGWLPPRTKADVSTAESQLKQKTLTSPGRDIAGNVIDALQDFVRTKYVLDALVRQTINDAQPGAWDNQIQKALELSEQINNAEDKKERAILNTKLGKKIADIRGLYARGLQLVENTIADEAAETENYPEYFNIDGYFVLEFENKFDTSLLTDMFPTRGEAIFADMDIRDWSALMVKYNRWRQDPTNDSKKLKVQKDASRIYEKLKNKPKSRLAKNEEAERKARGKAYGLLKDKAKPKTVEVKEETKKYSKEALEKSIERWDTISKDPKTLHEGNLLYLGVVGGLTTSDMAFNQELFRYLEVVGSSEAAAFVENIKRVEFTSPDVDVATKGGEALAKVSLLRQLWLNQVFGSEYSDDTSVSFINTLPGSPVQLEIASVSQRIADKKNLLAVIPDGPYKSDVRAQVIELTDRLVALEEQKVISQNLPTINTALAPEGEVALTDRNIVTYATVVIDGEQMGVSDRAKKAFNRRGLPEAISIEELQAHAARVKEAGSVISGITEKQALLTAEARSVSIVQDLETGLTNDNVYKADKALTKAKQLEDKKQEAFKMQLESARYIVGTELGVITVEGLEGPLDGIDIPSNDITEGLTEVKNASLDKEIAEFDTQISEQKKLLEEVKASEDTNKDLKELGILNEISMLEFFRNARKSVKVLPSLTLKVKGKLTNARETVTEEQKKRVKKSKIAAEDSIARIEGALDELYDSMTSHKGKVLLSISKGDVLDVISYALHSLDNDSNTSAAGLIATIAGSLPFNFVETLDFNQNRENRIAANYAASRIVTMLENQKILGQTPPEFFKDSNKSIVLDQDFVTSFQEGINLLDLEPDSKIAKRIKRKKKGWNRLEFNGIQDWNRATHPSGAKAVKKNSAQQNADMDSNVFKILNKAKNTRMRSNDELANIVEHMVNIEHPALTFTNKNYNQEQRRAKLRERDTIRAKSKEAKGRAFQYNYTFGSRGRLYALSSFLNQQASKHAKASIKFDTKKPMGNDGWGWLLADLAEAAGAKVNSLDDLQAHSMANLEEAMQIISDPIRNADKIFGDSDGNGGFDEPMLWMAAAIEIKNALAHGDPTTYPSNYVSYIDASVSGVQVLGGLLGATNELQHVNMLPGHIKQDLYAKVFEKVVEDKILLNPTGYQLNVYKEVADTLVDFDEEAKNASVTGGSIIIDGERLTPRQYVNEKRKIFKEEMRRTGNWDIYNGVYWGQELLVAMGRKASKGPVMTKNYNSKISGMSDALYDLFSIEKGITINKDNTRWLASELNTKADDLLTNIKDLRGRLVEIATELAERGEDFGFIGEFSKFEYGLEYREGDVIKLKHEYGGEPEGALDDDIFDSKILQLDLTIGNTETLDLRRIVNGIVANFTHAFDKEIIAWMMLKTDYDLLTVHDSLGTHLADVSKMFKDSRTAYNATINPDAFEEALAQNVGKEQAAIDRANLAPEDYDPEYVFQNQHNFGKSGKFDTVSAFKPLIDRAGGFPDTTLAERTDGLAVSETRDDRVIFKQSEGLLDRLYDLDEAAKSITKSTDTSLVQAGRRQTRIDNILGNIRSNNEKGDPNIVETEVAYLAVEFFKSGLVEAETTGIDVNKLEKLKDNVESALPLYGAYNSPKLDQAVEQLKSVLDNWYLDVLSNKEEFESTIVTDPLDNAVNDIMAKYIGTKDKYAQEHDVFAEAKEELEELYGDDFEFFWDDVVKHGYFYGDFDLPATDKGKISGELKIIQALLKRNLNTYGEIKFVTTTSESLVKKLYGEESNLPAGFYRRDVKSPLIVTHVDINDNQSAYEVIIHEADHRLNHILQTEFPDIWSNLVDFVSNTTEFKYWIKANVEVEGAYYDNLADDLDDQVDEFVAQMTGPEGTVLLNELEAQDKGFLKKILDIFRDLIDKIRGALSNTTEVKEIRDLVQLNLGVLLAGRRIESAFKQFDEAAPSRKVTDTEVSASFIKTRSKDIRKQEVIENSKEIEEIFYNISDDIKEADKQEALTVLHRLRDFTHLPTIGRRGKELEKDPVQVMGTHANFTTFEQAFFRFLQQNKDTLVAEGFTLAELVKAARYGITYRGNKKVNPALREFFNFLYSIDRDTRREALMESYGPSELPIVEKILEKRYFTVSKGTDETTVQKYHYRSNGFHTSLSIGTALTFTQDHTADEALVLTYKATTDELVYVGYRNEMEAVLNSSAQGNYQQYKPSEFKDADTLIEEENNKDKVCPT